MCTIDRLPKLRLSVSGSQALVQVKETALSLNGYQIEAEEDLFSGGTALRLAKGNGKRKTTVIYLFFWEGRKVVSIRLPDASFDITSSEYLAQVRSALTPLLTAYRKKFTDKVSLYVSPSPLAARNGRGARRIFDAFGVVANKHLPNFGDWSYFYEFIIYCYDRRVKLEGEELRELLLDAHFSPSAADDLARAYFHGREVLRLQGKARWSSAWARVIAKKGSFGV